ncbi:MAG: DUF6291 domain-containing protein [Eubacteriales bacterium]|nr:DUF6291 domain-containing protein [Eubacteriales bacterium]
MADRRKSFVLYTDYRHHLKLLRSEEQGRLLMSMFDYVENGIEPDFDGMLSMCWSFIRAQLDRDTEKYNSIREKRAASGRRGGKQTKANRANATFAKQTQANQADTVNVNDTVNGTVIKEEGKEETASAEPSHLSVNYQSIVDDYNATCTKLPVCRKLSDARRKAIGARLKVYSADELHTAFEKSQASSFLTGQNDRNWTANFDWILKDSNIAKILDGNYDNRKGQKHNEKNQYTKLFEKYTI